MNPKAPSPAQPSSACPAALARRAPRPHAPPDDTGQAGPCEIARSGAHTGQASAGAPSRSCRSVCIQYAKRLVPQDVPAWNPLVLAGSSPSLNGWGTREGKRGTPGGPVGLRLGRFSRAPASAEASSRSASLQHGKARSSRRRSLWSPLILAISAARGRGTFPTTSAEARGTGRATARPVLRVGLSRD